MNHDLKSYPVMKDSDLPWLGDVPSNWIMGKHTDFNIFIAEVEKDADKNGATFDSKRLLGEIVGSAQS